MSVIGKTNRLHLAKINCKASEDFSGAIYSNRTIKKMLRSAVVFAKSSDWSVLEHAHAFNWRHDAQSNILALVYVEYITDNTLSSADKK